MLFEISKNEIEIKQHEELDITSVKPNNKVRLGKENDLLSELIPGINKGEAIHLPSYSKWSFHHMVCHVLDLIGPAEVHLTSWTISEKPVKMLLQYLDSGSILRLHCLFDSRVKVMCPNAFQIAQHRFANLKLCHIHAKLAVLKNDNYAVTINSSGNLTRNPTIETYVLTESKELALFHQQWIEQKINEGNPFE